MQFVTSKCDGSFLCYYGNDWNVVQIDTTVLHYINALRCWTLIVLAKPY